MNRRKYGKLKADRLNAAFLEDKGPRTFAPSKHNAKSGKLAVKFERNRRFKGGCSVSAEAKTLGFMDANMREHRVNMHHFPSGKTWLLKGVC